MQCYVSLPGIMIISELPKNCHQSFWDFELKTLWEQELYWISKSLGIRANTTPLLWIIPMQYHNSSGFTQCRVEEQTQELCLHGTQSSTHCCLFLLYHLQPKGHVWCLQEGLCSSQFSVGIKLHYNYISAIECRWLFKAYWFLLIPLIEWNCTQVHHPTATASHFCSLCFPPHRLRACRMIYGGANEASCAISDTTVSRLCRGFVIPNK